MGELSLENARGVPTAVWLLFGGLLLLLGLGHLSFRGAVIL